MTDPYKRPDFVASNIRVAGVSFRANNESVSQCLRPATADDAGPGTPPHLKKYRKSY